MIKGFFSEITSVKGKKYNDLNIEEIGGKYKVGNERGWPIAKIMESRLVGDVEWVKKIFPLSNGRQSRRRRL